MSKLNFTLKQGKQTPTTTRKKKFFLTSATLTGRGIIDTKKKQKNSNKCKTDVSERSVKMLSNGNSLNLSPFFAAAAAAAAVF